MNDHEYKHNMNVMSEGGGDKTSFDFSQLFSMSQSALLAVLTDGIACDCHLSAKLSGSSQATLDMTGRNAAGAVFSVDDFYIFKSNPERAFIRIDEIRIEEAARGFGIGKQFLKNTVALCDQIGVNKIQLRAGREDGAFFWARHGFVLEGEFVFRNLSNVADNLEKYRDQMSETSIGIVEAALSEYKETAVWDIVDLPEVIDNKPIGALLLNGVEYRAELDLTNHEQRQRLDAALAKLPGGLVGPETAQHSQRVIGQRPEIG